MGSRPLRTERWGYAVLFAFLLLYPFPYQARLNNPNENVRLYMTAALVEHGTYAIDRMRERWGWVNDAATRDGHVYSVKAPGTSWLGVPGYAFYLGVTRMFGIEFDRTVALWVCRVTGTILPFWLGLLWLWRWLDSQTRHASLRDSVFVSVAFGSLLYGYGLLFVSHTLSALAAFVAFAGLRDAARGSDPPKPLHSFWLGTLTAWVTVLEYPGLIASIVLAAYALWLLRFRRALWWFAAGGVLPALAMMHFQWSAFGSPFSPGHLMVENDAFRSAHEQGLYGAVGPTWSSLHGLLTDPGAGLFPLTPLLLFALPGFYWMVRSAADRVAAWFALSLCTLTLLSIASMNNWRGGWTVGPRYLAVLVPFMAWAALVAFNKLAERWPRTSLAVASGAALAGVVASGAVSVYYPHLPPEFTRPLPQLIGLLVAHDYAPLNAGHWLAWHGTLSMVPIAIAALAVLYLGYRQIPRLAGRGVVLLGSLSTAGLFIAPLTLRPDYEPGVAEARAFVTRRWSPAGHDVAARIEQTLVIAERSGAPNGPRPDAYRELSEVYRSEGRESENLRTDRRGQRIGSGPRPTFTASDK